MLAAHQHNLSQDYLDHADSAAEWSVGCGSHDKTNVTLSYKLSCSNLKCSILNKYIGDDTKAAARQSPNCILKKYGKKTIFNIVDGIISPCNVAYGSRIMTVISPSGSTLQCGRCLWDDMPWNSPKRPPYCNYMSRFDFDHITAVDMSFCTSLRNSIQIGPPFSRKK